MTRESGVEARNAGRRTGDGTASREPKLQRGDAAGHDVEAATGEVPVREREPEAHAGSASEDHVASPIPDSPSPSPAAGLSRRQAIGLATAAVVLPALDFTDAQAQRAAQLVRRATPAAAQAAPKFFTADEWEIVRLLVDYIIPKDDRSGSATDAQVPEFMDYMLSDAETNEGTRVAMRGGLAWLDVECRRRFNSGFVASSDAQRRAVLDDIAWPERARPEMSHGVTFFNRFRDLTASGFFSSAIGYKDLDFRGNTFVAEWTGCPPAALTKLGVRYAN